jgi:protocatechuate 3,4-dioxygenase beta subunit
MLRNMLSAVLFHLFALFAATPGLLAQPVLTGIVQGTRYEPVSGARVELVPVLGNFEAGRLRLDGRDLPGPRATATTDVQGRFLLEAPEARAWKLVVRAAGRVPMEYGPFLALGADELPAVQLSPDVGARIRVAEENGDPVPGAWVVATAAGEALSRIDSWRPELRVGRTAADGSLTLPRFEGERLQVSAFAPGRPEALQPDFQEGTIQLRPAREVSLALQAVAPDGSPAAGLLLRSGDRSWPVGLTAADGTVLVPVREGETARLRLVSADGRQHVFSLRPGSGRRTVSFPPAAPVTGKVLDAGSGRSLADAVLWLDTDPALAVRTDREGRYTLTGPSKGRLQLEVRAAGFLPRRLTLFAKDLTSGRAPTVALERAARVRGSVLGPQGKPLPGAAVTAVHTSALGFRTFSPLDPVADRAAAGPAGGFELRQLRAGEEYELRVALPGFFPEARRIVTSRDAAPVTVQLQPACAVHGLLRDPEGHPVAAAQVFVRPARRPGRERKDRDPLPPAIASDPAGRFSLPESPAAEVDLEARKPGYAPALLRTVRIGPSCKGGSFDLGAVVLNPGARLAGRVVDPGGKAVPGAEVFLTDQPAVEPARGSKPDAVTGRDGSFALDDLQRGVPVHLFVQADGYLGKEVRGVRPPGSGPVLVRLEPAALLQGRVIDEAGEAVSGAEVGLTWQAVLEDDPRRSVGRPIERSAQSDAEGRFEIADAPRGEVRLTVRAQGFIPAEEPKLTLPRPGSAPELTFVLRRGARLEGRVATRSGKPVSGVRIVVDPGAAFTDAEGLYVLDGLATGPQEVRVFHPEYKRRARTIAIVEGTNRFDVELEDGVEVSGRVVDPDGKPVLAAEVELVTLDRSDLRRQRARTGEDGAFLLQPVAAGAYRLQATASGFAPEELARPVVVADRPVEGLEIVLRQGATVGGRVLGLSPEELALVLVTAHGKGVERPARLDSEGRFEVRDLEAGDWLLRASLWQGERQVEARVPVGPSDRQIERDLEFSPRVTLSGRVLFDGEPLGASTIAVRGERFSIERSVVSGSDGSFVLRDLEPDRYWLGVQSSQRMIAHNDTLDLYESREVEIRLEAGTIAGRVEKKGSGEAVPNAILTLRPTQGPEFQIIDSSQPDGSFRILHVPPGTYRLGVVAQGYAPAEREVSVTAGGQAAADLALTPASGLDLQVRLASGQTPPMVHVLARNGAGATVLAGTYAQKSGTAELSSLPAGTWQLTVSAPGGGVAMATVTAPGEPVALTLPPAGRLHVRVPDLTTENRLATIKLLRQGQEPFWTLGLGGTVTQSWTMQGGDTVVDGVPAGVWSVIAEASDGRVWTGSVVTPGTGEASVSLP